MHERIVKLRVQHGLLVKRRADVIVVGQGAHARDLGVGRAADDVPAHVRLEHDAQIQYVFERAVAQREQRADRPVDRQLRRVRDVRAAALDALHDAHGLQALDRLAHARAADVEFRRQTQLRRQFVAFLEPAVIDLIEDGVHDFFVICTGLWFHVVTSMSDIHKMRPHFLNIMIIHKGKMRWYDESNQMCQTNLGAHYGPFPYSPESCLTIIGRLTIYVYISTFFFLSQ